MMDDELLRLGKELAMEFPPVPDKRGWMLANLSHMIERTPQGAEEVWSVDVLGPTDIFTEWHQMVGRPRISTVRVMQGVTGSIEAPSFEALRLLVRKVAQDLALVSDR